MKRIQFYAAVVIPGAVLMALEIVSSRVLAPQFGSSVYVWGSIIGVFLAAMSLGYVWGGRLADARPHLASLGGLLIGAAGAQAVVLLLSRPLVAALGEWTGGAPWGTLVATSVLFGPPTVLLATVAPYAVKLATRDLSLLGGTAGHLYAISTGGSLLGTLGATFGLIPYLELDSILRLLLTATALTGLGAVGTGYRQRRLVTALGLSLVVLGFAGRFLPSGKGDFLVQRITPYQTLQIYDRGGVRHMESDGTLHAAVDVATGETELMYAKVSAAALLFDPEIESLLVLGMGAGSVGTYLGGHLPDLRVDYVDIDPAVPELARELMFFREGERSAVHVEDARRFLKESDHTWDFIYADTYIGHSVPFHLSTVEFFKQVKERLKPGGVFGVNLLSSPHSPYGSAFIKSVRQAFRQTYVFNVPVTNFFIVATDREERWDRGQIAERAGQLEGRWDFDHTMTELAELLSRTTLDLSEAQLLRDAYAPVNHLVFQEREGPEPEEP